MVTFNADSLDFVDDEAARFGAAPDFDLLFDSADTRLELRDLVNGVTAYIQQNRAGDLVDGRLAQTVDEGKVLADNGSLYDTFNAAENAASNWIKAGPGYFQDWLEITTAGLTVFGSGKQTVITGNQSRGEAIYVNADGVEVAHLSVSHGPVASDAKVNGIVGASSMANQSDFHDLYIYDVDGPIQLNSAYNSRIYNNVIRDCRYRIEPQNTRILVANNIIQDIGNRGVYPHDDAIIVGNDVINTGGWSGTIGEYGMITLWGNDNICVANRVHNSPASGIYANGTDTIVANNRISDSATSDINDQGTSTLLDANVTGPAN